MFQAGDLLVYGITGVCRVLSIDRRQERVGSTRQERLYYQLKPIYQGGLIYTPVDNDKVSMRPIISRQEAEDLISMAYPTIDLAATGAHIRQLRLEQGYSVQDLQTYLGLEHPQAIYHWQHGRNLPSVDNLYALSKLWGVPMDKIIVEQAA